MTRTTTPDTTPTLDSPTRVVPEDGTARDVRDPIVSVRSHASEGPSFPKSPLSFGMPSGVSSGIRASTDDVSVRYYSFAVGLCVPVCSHKAVPSSPISGHSRTRTPPSKPTTHSHTTSPLSRLLPTIQCTISRGTSNGVFSSFSGPPKPSSYGTRSGPTQTSSCKLRLGRVDDASGVLFGGRGGTPLPT